MAVLDRPTPDKIDSEVLSALESGEEITFPELEKRVQANLPQLANRIQVRQSAWRLVRDKRATVTRDMKLKKPS